MPFTDIIGHALPIEWLQRAIQANRLAHAYLFAGEDAIGKQYTAFQFAQALHCETDLGISDACGRCRSCHQMIAHTHPDFLSIQPDQEQTRHPQIKIEQVREIEHHIIYRPLVAQRKICLINDADQLTTAAANALLKTLEEPPDHSMFILITSRPFALLPTVRSRCCCVRFSPPTLHQVITHLMKTKNLSEAEARFIAIFSGSHIGKALQLDYAELHNQQQEWYGLLQGNSAQSLSECFDTAERLAKSEQVRDMLDWLWHGLRDLLLLTIHGAQEHILALDHLTALQALAQQTSQRVLLNLLDELQTLEQGMQRNLNLQLGLERFFLHMHEGLHRSSS